MTSQDSLINRYRPISFSEVLGNEPVVTSLQEAVTKDNPPHAYLLTGPSGVGKTTLARIIASTIGAIVQEIDVGGSDSTVDTARKLVEASYYQPLGATSKLVIIDECHILSPNAWTSLLKLLEEPPSYLYIALCTTNIAKVPDAIKTRCFHVNLKQLKVTEMEDLIQTVCELESWQLKPEVYQGIIQASTGQPRKALTILEAAHNAQDREALASIVAGVETKSAPLVELCRFLLNGGKDWDGIAQILNGVGEDDESLVYATKYLTTVMLGSNSIMARRVWVLLDALTFPRAGYDRKSQLVASIGAILWSANGQQL